MKLNGNKQPVLERIAKLAFSEVPDEQIADVMGCSVSELKEFMLDEDYKKIYADYVVEKYESKETRNVAWDDIESTSLAYLMGNLDSYQRDADFLLKTAMIANKAQRRQASNQPINGQAGEMVAVLHLQQTFIQTLQQYGVGTGDRPGREIPQKSQDFLDVGKVEEILEFRPGPEITLKAR